MCFNIGVIIGPVLGGLLADPVGSYPTIFGPNSLFGGKDGVWWMTHWPYALPNLMSAVFLLSACAAVAFGLEEVSSLLYVLTTDSNRLRPWTHSEINQILASALVILLQNFSNV